MALGGLHSFNQVGPRAAYAGALERVGPAPWKEAVEEKGFVLADLSARTLRFRPVAGRPVVDMAPTRVPPGDPAALQARILEVTREIPGGIEGKIGEAATPLSFRDHAMAAMGDTDDRVTGLLNRLLAGTGR